MAFESLSDKLQSVFKSLRGKGRLTEDDVKAALKEVKMALLEADVNFKVVKQFTKSVQERAVGEEVMNGLNPAQMVIKIVRDEMITLMGSEKTELEIRPGREKTVIMMMGLQGAGKTTAAAKLAVALKKTGKKPVLVACDIYRPAAIKQLEINAEKVGVDVFSMGTDHGPVEIATAAMKRAEEQNNGIVIIDTAGRLQIDEDMMDELVQIREAVGVTQTVLVVDATTGQMAVDVAKAFEEKIGISGVILTKLDGDTRGGAAISIRSVTGKPILYIGMSEKVGEELQQFYPDRMTSRILGMGDIESAIEKAEQNIDKEKALQMQERMKKGKFDYNDYLDQMEQLNNMGGLGSIMDMLPGLTGGRKVDFDADAGEKQLKRITSIIYSMTPQERSNPDLLNPSRKNRIAKGAGVTVAEVNRMVKQFDQMRKMVKQMPGMLGGKRGKRGRFSLPF